MSTLSFLIPYKNQIALVLLLALLGGVGLAGYKAGAFVTQARWDKESLEEKGREIELAEKVINLQSDMDKKNREQAVKDAEAAARHSAEREALESQARESRSALERLTRALERPQYQQCKLDPETLHELNRSLQP